MCVCDANACRSRAVRQVMLNHRRNSVENHTPDCIMHNLHQTIYSDFLCTLSELFYHDILFTYRQYFITADIIF
jgi:hypothetical protein